MDGEGLRYVFGPVLSGRLGRSLGLDLLGARVCSMNCVYCESGPLEKLTLERKAYVRAADIEAELRAWDAARAARGEPLPDVVTLGGMGEPTLNSEMPRVIAAARRVLPGVPVAVLTNAGLMTDPAVRAELALADVVLPNMDSLVPEEFARVNRAHKGLDPAAIAEGIVEFAHGFTGRIHLEILLVAGINDSGENLARLEDFCRRLRPARVDVVTLSRPGTEAWAKPVDADTLAAWRTRLNAAGGQTRRADKAPNPAALAGNAEKRQEQPGGISAAEARLRVLASLSRRPQTAAQLSGALMLEASQIDEALRELVSQGLAEVVPGQDGAPSKPGAAQAPTYFQARG